MSFRIFGFAVVPTAYLDRLERTADELIDLKIRSEKEREEAALQAEDLRSAMAVLREDVDRYRRKFNAAEDEIGRLKGLMEDKKRIAESLAHEQEKRRALEAVHENAMTALHSAEDRLEEAEKELRQWREMGTTVQEWANLLTYDGSRQKAVSESDKDGE